MVVMVELTGEPFEGQGRECFSESLGAIGRKEHGGGIVAKDGEEAEIGAGIGPRGEGTTVGASWHDGGPCNGDAMPCVLQGAGEGNDEVWDGTDLQVTVADTTEGGGVMGKGKGMGRKLGRVACKAANEVMRLSGYGGEEGGRPGMERRGSGGIEGVVDIGGEEVRKGGLGTGTEERALGLAVVELGGEFVKGGGVVSGSGGEVAGNEGGAANRKAEEANTISKLRVGGTVVAEVVEGRLEVVAISSGEGGERGGAGDGSEDLGFGHVEADAVGVAEFLKTEEEPKEVDVLKHRVGIVEVAGGGGREGNVGGGVAGELALLELLIERDEHTAKDESSETAAERATLGETFVLGEKVPVAVSCLVPAAVGVLVEEVEVGEKDVQFREFSEFMAARVARNGVEHVDDVKEKEGGVGIRVVFEQTLDLGKGGVNDKVQAATDANSKLTGG